MNPLNLQLFLTTWDGGILVSKNDGTKELATKVALDAIGSLSVVDTTRELLKISGKTPLLIGKIGRLISHFQTLHSLSKADIEATLHLTTWEAGPNTEIAKLRILSCYLENKPSLDLSNLELTSLPESLNLLNIKNLNCSNNSLSALCALPNHLKTLICSHNRLSSLPELPSGLTNIDMEDNFITVLPPLPPSLSNLICINNLIRTPPYTPPGTIATFSLRKKPPINLLMETLQELAGADFSDSLEEINPSIFNEDFVQDFMNWYDLLKHQPDFQTLIGQKNLALLLLKTVSLSSKDRDYFDLVKAALSEALDTCTDRSLYYLNFITVARKLKETASVANKISILKGGFAFSFLEKIAKEIIELRLIAKSFSLGRDLLEQEIQEIKKEEIELYLALQIKLKDHFCFPTETTSMRFSGLDRLSEQEILFAKTLLYSKLENREDFLDFCATEESWKECIKKIHSDEFLPLTTTFQEELAKLMTRQEVLEKVLDDATGESEKEGAYADLLDCRSSIGEIMEEMKKTEFDFIKIKTKKLIEILQELSNWRGGSKSEEAKKRVIAAYVTKSSSLDLSYLSLTSLPKCLSDFSHLSYLNCSHNLLTSLPFLPHLEVLNCSFNRIYFLPPFSDRVKINAAVNPYLQKL